MKRQRRTIRVFEHGRLRAGNAYRDTKGGLAEFKEHHLDALAAFNQRHGGKFFTLARKAIVFTQYVGFVQVGRLGIEILPKADRSAAEVGEEARWHDALIRMLLATRRLRTHAPEQALLASRRADLFTVYVEAFLTSVERLVREGLVRRYRSARSNERAFRGRLLVADNLRDNLVHAERFFVEHITYDFRNFLNRVLHSALDVLARVDVGPRLSSRVRRLLLVFPDQDRQPVRPEELHRIVLGRSAEKYGDALTIARFILVHYSPDVRAGREDVLALLFDMNALFEEFISLQMRRALRSGYDVRLQRGCPFWQTETSTRTLQPDITVRDREDGSTTVIDCKWKLPGSKGPSMADLRQIFAYNEHFDAEEGILLYPASSDFRPAHGVFVKRGSRCRVESIDLCEGDRINLHHVRKQLCELLLEPSASARAELPE